MDVVLRRTNILLILLPLPLLHQVMELQHPHLLSVARIHSTTVSSASASKTNHSSLLRM